MDQQQDGERLDSQYLREITIPATTAELIQLTRSIISHPSTKGAPMNSVISLLLAHIATTVKAQRPNNNLIVNEQERKKNLK